MQTLNPKFFIVSNAGFISSTLWPWASTGVKDLGFTLPMAPTTPYRMDISPVVIMDVPLLGLRDLGFFLCGRGGGV